jgi:hypothetical protein
MENMTIDSQCSQDLIQCHLNLKKIELSTLIGQLSQVACHLTDFALSLPQFAILCPEDQATLLKYNVSLYLQYVAARYFSAETGLEQMTWILEGQLFTESVEKIEDLTYVSLAEFQGETNFFSSIEFLEMFSHYVKLIGSLFPFPQHCNGLISTLLLFHTSDSSRKELKDWLTVERLYLEIKGLAENELKDLMNMKIGCDDLTMMMQSLTQMKSIFEMCEILRGGSKIVTRVPRIFTVNFTEAEDNWIKLRFSQINSQFISVVPSEDLLIQGVNLLAYRIPVTETYFPELMLTITERVRRVLKIHQEFENMSDTDQECLWRKNYKNAAIVASMRINVQKNGNAQMKTIIGVIDSQDDSWENQYSGLIPACGLKPAYLHEDELNLGRLDESEKKCLLEMISHVSELCFNDQTFQLLLLLTLLDVDGLPQSGSFHNIINKRNIYLKFLQRKLHAANCSYIDYAKFKTILHNVKILTNLMESFMK